MKPIFQENQRFNQWWVWLIILLAGGFPIIGLIQQVYLDKPFGDQPMSNTGLFLTSGFYLLFIIFFYYMQLQTKITQETIYFRFIPFVKRIINFNEIETYKVINYGFVGGWGIRLGTKYGTVYNIRGNKGLFIKLKNGKSFVIGTQKPDELRGCN
ncbi:MAG TPA: hypothetical protein VLY87_00695 [Flavobacterium sp.]|nr:hypothetical protein [Flavobacterium sp.]